MANQDESLYRQLLDHYGSNTYMEIHKILHGEHLEPCNYPPDMDIAVDVILTKLDVNRIGEDKVNRWIDILERGLAKRLETERGKLCT